MRVEETCKGPVELFHLSGKVMGGEDLDDLRHRLKQCVTSGVRQFVIDLGEVEWINSTGLGLLIGMHVTVSKCGGHLALSRVESIQKLLDYTRLSDILDTYDSTEEALERLKAMEHDPEA